MKKNVLLIATAVLLVISMCLSFVACKKTKVDETTTAESTTETTQTPNPSETTTKAPASGEQTTGEQPSVTEMSVEEVEKDAPVASGGLAGNLSDKTVNKMDDFKPSQSTGGRLKDNYKELFKGGKVLMKASIESNVDAEMNGSTIMFALDGNKYYFEFDMMGINIATLRNNSKTYLLSPADKLYTRAPSEGDTDMTQEELTASLSGIFDDENLVYSKTETVKEGGKNLTCETYRNGTVIQKYYFDGTTLVKVDVVSGEEVMTIKIEKLTNDFDDSLFKIPRGYIATTNTLFITKLASKFTGALNIPQ